MNVEGHLPIHSQIRYNFKMTHKSSNRSISRRGRVRALSKPIGFLLLSFVVSLATSSAARSKRRRLLMDDNAPHSQNTAEHASTKHSGCCDGKAVVSSHRKACGFYVWDLPSALLYKWCQHLVKDKIYEGKGGYVFVRYESNSILKLLYPCSRYSPNKCMICGGSYDDHLELWWSKHLYSPYDQYLDRTYNEALVIQEEDGMTNKKRRLQRRNKRKSSDTTNSSRNSAGKRSQNSSFVKTISASSPFQTLADPPTFNFHKRYVEDVTDIVRGIRSRREQKKLLKKKLPAFRSLK